MASTLVIVGAGLIGASFARAVAGRFGRVLAVEPDPDHARTVIDEQVVDAVVDSVPADCEAILLACPSDRIADWVARLADHTGTVFDSGSVKGVILSEVADRLGAVPANFVPCHPIAGRERSGPAAADAGLFKDRTVIMTPVATTDAMRIERVEGWWTAAGGRVKRMQPAQHDAVYAVTSHLPHLLAFAYLQGVGADDMAHIGGGFRDFSRIGGSDPDMWTAIFDRNRDALLPALDRFEADLKAFRFAIEAGDLAACRALITRARNRRKEA